ncbi:type II secretion system minor pseudopilin GspJ [Erwinia sp. B116]|uniref:type II secretion system minor pseudopilin GspJ n=1 Tax=Erwinia sp. B116 TaxID=1561024 RepID=UPI000C783368|nr:type II secretion system minor pseudopilin GspJ [Erwinia sp. B116]PLV62584.1 hypothetical protein NV64_04300 [Erwinia sp. B116]
MRRIQQGFTLLEMMVALAIFSVVGLVGYQLLQGMLRNGEQLKEHSSRLNDEVRIIALLSRDLAQAAIPAHPAQVPAGDVPFFTSNHDEERLRLTRRNWLNPLQTQRSSLQRVAWRFSAGTLTRVSLSDGQTGAQFSGISSLQLRFWAGGSWHTDWPATHSLPEAIEVTLTMQPWGEFKHIALLQENHG